jgi:Arc/MetJ-type ribon-helix-helix transcriptional regulator
MEKVTSVSLGNQCEQFIEEGHCRHWLRTEIEAGENSGMVADFDAEQYLEEIHQRL